MIVPVFLPHLGCRERCIYCDQQYITDLRETDLHSVIEKSMSLHEGPFEVGLYGGNIFGIKVDQLRQLFSCFDAYREKITNFRISTKPVPLNDEIIDILKANRVQVIELGIPTFNDKILSKLNRHHTARDLYSTYGRLKTEDIHVALQVMVGLPDESMDDIGTTVQNVTRLNPCYLRIYPLVVLSGTRLGEMYKNRRFQPISFEEALDRTVFIYLNALRHGIKVVKMGLTDNEVIKEKILAGHYHPAFGYLVKSRAFYLAVLANLCASPAKGKDIMVHLNNRDVPHLIGDRRINITRFEEEGIFIKWKETNIERDTFLLEYGGRSTESNIFAALHMFQ